MAGRGARLARCRWRPVDRRIVRSFATLAGALTAGGAGAQVTPAPPPVPALPSRSQVEQPTPPLTAPAATIARVSGRNAVPTAPCPLADSPLRVAIARIAFTAAGRDALPPAVAAALAGIAPPAGEQPIASVCTIRDEANAALARAGFVASVQVPPQRIADGTLTLAVVLARIVEVRVRGEAGPFRPVLARAIEKLRALDPVNEREAERLLLLTGDVPGLDLQLALRPAGTGPGEVIGDLTVATRRVAVLANVQNYGSRELGRETAYLRVDINSVIAADDAVYVGGSTTRDLREQQVVQIGYRGGAPASGWTAGPRLTVAWSRPDLGDLDLRSRSIIGGFDATWSPIRTVRRNLSLTAGFEAIEQSSRIHDDAGSSPLTLDRLRVLYLRADGRASGRGGDGEDRWALAGTAELRRGLSILGATRRGDLSRGGYAPSRFDGDPEAFVARGALSALGRIGRRFSIAQTVIGQWADAPLLNFEEQAIGSLTAGLGYDPGANTGDRFLGVHSEARVDLGIARNPLQVFGFGDTIRLWNLDAFSIEGKRHLRSVGGGARVRLPGPMVLEVTYARPLDRALSIDRARAGDRLLVSLTAQLTPSLLGGS